MGGGSSRRTLLSIGRPPSLACGCWCPAPSRPRYARRCLVRRRDKRFIFAIAPPPLTHRSGFPHHQLGCSGVSTLVRNLAHEQKGLSTPRSGGGGQRRLPDRLGPIGQGRGPPRPLTKKIEAAGLATRTKARDRTRSVRRRAHDVAAWLRRRNDDAKEEVKAITAECRRRQPPPAPVHRGNPRNAAPDQPLALRFDRRARWSRERACREVEARGENSRRL